MNKTAQHIGAAGELLVQYGSSGDYGSSRGKKVQGTYYLNAAKNMRGGRSSYERGTLFSNSLTNGNLARKVQLNIR